MWAGSTVDGATVAISTARSNHPPAPNGSQAGVRQARQHPASLNEFQVSAATRLAVASTPATRLHSDGVAGTPDPVASSAMAGNMTVLARETKVVTVPACVHPA